MTHRGGLLSWVASGMALAGVAWLAPLMLDQFVLFGDQEQAATAAASRSLMVWPSFLLVGAALVVAAAGRTREAALVAAPLVAVVLAHASPESAWQLLAYAVTAPISVGAALAIVAPMRGALAGPVVLVALLVAGIAAALSTLFLAALLIIGLIAWWLLSQSRAAPVADPAVHRR